MEEGGRDSFRIYNPNQNEDIRKRDMFGQMNDKDLKGTLVF